MSLMSCASGGNTSSSATSRADASTEAVTVTFDADSAYSYVARQTAFGPRVPNTTAHDECGRWLAAELRRHGADTVITQPCVMTAYDGTQLRLTNIMAQYAPELNDRILLVAHWDSRHMADNESDPVRRRRPIDGANDGASGVGVLLETARQTGAGAVTPAKVGVDILLVDGEDYGEPSDGIDENADSWCLGTQYWTEHQPYPAGTRLRGAILLDMVGGRGAVFPREQLSDYFAPQLNNAVWAVAARLGLGDRFPQRQGGGITDDHLYLNRAGIPAIDIIESAHPATGSFNPTWHTLDDNIDNIDRETLGAVGAVVTEYIRTLQQ